MAAPASLRSATRNVQTRRGTASLHITRPAGDAVAVVLLGHGAGGDSTAPSLLTVSAALAASGVVAARFDQPYRVAGRRAPAPATHLDEAAYDVATALRAVSGIGQLPLVLGGKSSGARVACRIAASLGAAGVVALGFPLRPPGRPERSRAPELTAAGAPILVCQGERDAFGSPEEVLAATAGLRAEVHPVPGGDHSFVARRGEGRSTADNLADVAAVAVAWVRGQTAAT